jgi:hypothetical protein
MVSLFCIKHNNNITTFIIKFSWIIGFSDFLTVLKVLTLKHALPY